MQATHAEHLEKRKLNRLAPISRLHLEIFSIVFCHVRDSIIRPAYSVWAWRQTKDWIGLTQVCHAWRDIAINTPTLWTEMFVSVEDHLEWVQEMLRRSKQCSLSIIVSKPPESALPASEVVDPILHRLKDHMHRFRKLMLLDIPTHDLHDFFSNSNTNRLEYLHIIPYRIASGTDSDSSSSDTSSVTTFTLRDNLLPVDSLRYLNVESCGLDFHAAFLRSLTHLELLDIDEDCRLPCIEFVAVLAAIPGLEGLRLEGFLKEDEVQDVGEEVTMTNKTHLHIKYLDLASRILGEMVRFLWSLILPSSCKLRLHMSDESFEITPSSQLITSWLSKHFHTPSFHSFRSYLRGWRFDELGYVASDLRVAGFYDSELEGSDIDIGGETDKALLSASVSLCHDFESGVNSIHDFWRSFLKSLPLSDIVFLEVKDDSMTLPNSVWVDVFASLTTLKTIIIHSQYYAAFFNIASPGSIALPFPTLSSVTVKTRCIEDYLSIVMSLDSRMKAGLPPLSLVFYTDDIEPHAITRLRMSALNVQIHRFY